MCVYAVRDGYFEESALAKYGQGEREIAPPRYFKLGGFATVSHAIRPFAQELFRGGAEFSWSEPEGVV